MLIGLCLPAAHPWHGQAEALGGIAWGGPPAELGEAALTALDVLVLDADGLTHAELDTLRRFRVQRPATRIVVSVPDGTETGGPVLSALVALGIYDLAPPATPLSTVLSHTGTYADAARWVFTLDPETGLPPTVERVVVEKEVIREVVKTTSSRPNLIAVSALAAGCGSTTAALAIAGTLAQKGHTVALWSADTPPPASSIPAGVESVPRGAEAPDPATLVRRHGHEYVVADFGYTAEGDQEQQDLRVLLLPGAWARADRLWPSEPPPADGAPVVALAGPGPESPAVAERWAALDGYGQAYAWPSDPKRAVRTWTDLLAPVLPTTSPGRNWWTHKRPAPKRRRPAPEPEPEPEWSPAPWSPTAPPAPPVYALPPVYERHSAHPLRVFGQAFELAFIVALIGAIVYVAGIIAEHGGLPGRVGWYAMVGQQWEARLLAAILGRGG